MAASNRYQSWDVADRILVRGLTACSTRNENPRLVHRARVPLSFLPRDAAGIAGAADGRVVGDGAFAVKFVEMIVQQHHAVLASGLERVFQMVQLVFADQIPHRAGGHEQFVGKHAPGAVGGRQQILRDDSLQRVRELQNNLLLRAAFKHTDDALQRVGNIRRVHRGQHEMAGFRRRQRGGNRLVIAHFADDNHVRVLPQDVDQRAVERAHVGQHLLLHHDGVLVGVDKFNRVFNRDNFAAALVVDEVNEIIQRRRLARAGGAGNENQAVRLARQVVEFFGQPQFLARLDFVAAKAEAQFRVIVAPVKSRAHAAGGAVEDGNAQFPFLLELFPLRLVHQAVGHRVNLLLGQRVLVGDDDFAVDTERGGTPATRWRSDASKSFTADSSRLKLSALIC